MVFTMNLPDQLYKLQQFDSELQRQRQYIEEIDRQLSGNKALATAEATLTSIKQQLTDMRKSQKNADWKLEDMTERSRDINNKLYTGIVHSPKELLSLKHEAESLKQRIDNKEEELLEIMGQVEEMETQERSCSQKCSELTQEWQQKQITLAQKRAETEKELVSLNKSREEALQHIDPGALRLYQQIKTIREQAVVRVQQGQCQGCHMALPIGQGQKAKAGEIVQCSNCSRILYVQ
jgi:predicted  nucleic acid-binding Zn-ribbon protein